MRRFAMVMMLGTLAAAPSWSSGEDEGVEFAGTWRLDERSSVIRFHQADGGWEGVIEASKRPEEVGRVLMHSLRQVRPAELRGTLVMPENGSTHEVVVTIKGDTAKAVAGAFIFTKTLEFTRVK